MPTLRGLRNCPLIMWCRYQAETRVSSLEKNVSSFFLQGQSKLSVIIRCRIKQVSVMQGFAVIFPSADSQGSYLIPFLCWFLYRYSKESQNKSRSSLSYEVDPSITMFSATWNKKNLFAVHKAWFVNLSARLVSVYLSDNHIEELPDELFNTLPVLEVLDVSKNRLKYLPDVSNTFTRYLMQIFNLFRVLQKS